MTEPAFDVAGTFDEDYLHFYAAALHGRERASYVAVSGRSA